MFQECKMIPKYLTLPCIHLTHLTSLPRSRFGRMRWVIHHRDVEKSVGATDFPAPYAVMSSSRACAVWQREGCVGCV